MSAYHKPKNKIHVTTSCSPLAGMTLGFFFTWVSNIAQVGSTFTFVFSNIGCSQVAKFDSIGAGWQPCCSARLCVVISG